MKTFGYQLKTFARANGAGKRSALFAFLFIAAFAAIGAAQKQFATDERFSILAPQASDFTNRQAAASVLGQPDFSSNSAGATAAKVNNPDGAVIDPISKKAFLVDQFNNRVLRFASAAALLSGSSAEAVFGQVDFTSTSIGTTASKFNVPFDVSVDAAGRLWVADFSNCRVLRFDSAATKLTGASADGVLGQTDFTSGGCGVGVSYMSLPSGVFADAGGRVWVADFNNNRVLRFDNAATKANGANPDGVLGQPDFNNNSAAAGANKMNHPRGVNLDTGGRLYVAEQTNSRVLRFDNAAAKANGANADAVFGQPDFTTASLGTSASKMNQPFGVATDANNRLYVSEYGNSRVIIFNNAETAASGASANVVLGQPDFTSNAANNGGVSAISLFQPFHLSFDETSASLFVADRNNNRILRFAAPAAPTAASVTVSGRVLTPNRRGLMNATVVLTDASGDIRTARTSNFGYYRFNDVAAGQTYIFRVVSKRYKFAPQVVTVTEEAADLNFTAK